MAFNIGCPSCSSTDHIKIRIDGEWPTRLTTCESKYSIGEITPYVCLNCGAIYIDKKTLNLLNSKVNNNDIS